MMNFTPIDNKGLVEGFCIIKSIDEDAFITQANVNGVYGQGFDAMKLKVPHRHRSEREETHEKAGIGHS